MINTNDLWFAVDEELSTINFNTWTVLKIVFSTRAPYRLIYWVRKFAYRSFDSQFQSHI